VDVETLTWLLTDAGQRLLAEASAAYHDHDGDVVRAGAAVRKVETDPDRAAAALTQARLRVRAVAKLGDDAQHMYFTPEALEQATRARVAAHRAARLSAARPASVVDLGCGIGADLVAFAHAGITAAGVDLDPVRVAVARANLEALGVAGAVQVAEATTVDLDAFGAAYVDPARRSARGRVLDAEGWTPPWPFVVDLLGRHGLAKVAPGIPHDMLPTDVEAEWVSEGGDVTEASLWAPRFASASRRATVIPGPGRGSAAGLASLTEDDDPYDGQPRPLGPVGAYLYEPDGAVIRAGLVTAVAAGVGGHLVDEHIAYVTGDDAFRTPFARSYRVVEELPYREKQLRAALRERGVGRLTIKKRGVGIVPEELRKRLSLKGDEEATIVLTRVAGAGTALLVEPF
jgi:SAM-dependent methyltransferase